MSVLQNLIVSEWDKNAEARHKQIISKIDLSYHKVLIPTIFQHLGTFNGAEILDVGCGSGILASNLANNGAVVTGVDPSNEMIRIANREYGIQNNLNFHVDFIQNFAILSKRKFDIIVSNMSLIAIENLNDALFAIGSLLKSNGKFLFNITHPKYWNLYRKYESNEEFEYEKEHAQRGRFKISCDFNGLPSPTTHFHRPLEQYFASLQNHSLRIECVEEPFPNSEDMKLYPESWKFPRFLFIKCIKI